MKDYLPSDSPSTVSLEVMEKEFDGGISNARVTVKNITVPEAEEKLNFWQKLLRLFGLY